MRCKVAFGGGLRFEHAWPERLEPRDPRAGDEVLLAPGDWENHRLFAGEGALSRERFHALDERFRQLWPGLLAGRVPDDELHELARAMGLDGPPREDARRCDPVDPWVDDGLLADIAGNYIPEVGPLAAERVLGPFADLRLPPALRRKAVGLLATIRMVAPAERPIERFCEDKPRPPVALRAALRAALLAPPMVYQLGERPGPLLPLAPGFRLPLPAGLPPCPAILGRLVPTPGGTAFVLGLPLPIVPAPGPLMRRLRWELWAVRRHELRLTWEDLLRERGEVLYRAVMEQVWERWLLPGGGAWPMA